MLATVSDNAEFAKFSAYHTPSVATPNNYADTFVRGALTDTVPTRLPLASELRRLFLHPPSELAPLSPAALPPI